MRADISSHNQLSSQTETRSTGHSLGPQTNIHFSYRLNHIFGDLIINFVCLIYQLNFLDAIKQLIMFGDAYAHDFEDFPTIFKDPKFPLAKHQLDWRDEADELLSKVRDENISSPINIM